MKSVVEECGGRVWWLLSSAALLMLTLLGPATEFSSKVDQEDIHIIRVFILFYFISKHVFRFIQMWNFPHMTWINVACLSLLLEAASCLCVPAKPVIFSVLFVHTMSFSLFFFFNPYVYLKFAYTTYFTSLSRVCCEPEALTCCADLDCELISVSIPRCSPSEPHSHSLHSSLVWLVRLWLILFFFFFL